MCLFASYSVQSFTRRAVRLESDHSGQIFEAQVETGPKRDKKQNAEGSSEGFKWLVKPPEGQSEETNTD